MARKAKAGDPLRQLHPLLAEAIRMYGHLVGDNDGRGMFGPRVLRAFAAQAALDAVLILNGDAPSLVAGLTPLNVVELSWEVEWRLGLRESRIETGLSAIVDAWKPRRS